MGMGPATAYKYLLECGSIEGVLHRINLENQNPHKKKKMVIPDNFQFELARHMFLEPDVIKDKAILEDLVKFNRADDKALREFLVTQKGFGQQKVDNGISKLKKWQRTPNQGRLTNFFNGTLKQ